MPSQEEKRRQGSSLQDEDILQNGTVCAVAPDKEHLERNRHRELREPLTEARLRQATWSQGRGECQWLRCWDKWGKGPAAQLAGDPAPPGDLRVPGTHAAALCTQLSHAHHLVCHTGGVH